MTKTVGRPKSDDRKRLERVDLTFELRDSTLRQIAQRFEVTVDLVQTVLTKQLTDKFNKKRAFTPDPESDDYELKMLDLETDGSWSNSPERESWEKYKNKFIGLNFYYKNK